MAKDGRRRASLSRGEETTYTRLRCPKCPTKHYYGVVVETDIFEKKASLACPNCASVLVIV